MIYLLILAYLLNVIAGRALYFALVKIDQYYYPNPPAVLCWFIPIVGPLILLLLLIFRFTELRIKTNGSISDNSIFKFIFIPKHLRKWHSTILKNLPISW